MRVLKMVLRNAFSQIGIGMAIGIPAAIGAGKLMSDQLYGVTAWNPRAFAWTVISLTLVWILSEARATLRLREPYVVPDGEAKQ